MSKPSGVLVLLLCAALAAGCTSTSSPSAPSDTAAPAAVRDVQARAVSGGVQLSWAAGSEPDLEAYRIYRSAPGEAAMLVAVETTATYVDTDVVARTVYRYQVTAVDATGNESARGGTLTVYIGARPGHQRSIDN